MSRRLYFLLPDVKHTQCVVEELEQSGVDKIHMHTLAREDIDISSLPAANQQQKKDQVWFLDRLFWNSNLILFCLALSGLITSLYWGFSLWSVLAISIMLVTFIAGERFAVKLPHVHLDEVKGALSHGEILLMVDIPRKRVAEVDNRVLSHHPEAELGGIGWTIEAFGI